MNKNSKKKFIIFISIIIVVILILSLITSFLQKKPQDSDSNENPSANEVKSMKDFNSVKEIIEFSSSKYIEEVSSEEQGYKLKFKVEFKYNLYENNESMEKYFLSIINRISYLYKYKLNYILEDEKNNINIKVKCNESSIESIIINGEENYYLKRDNKTSENKSKMNEYTELVSNSSELKKTISEKWQFYEDNFGIKDSEFNDYNLFWDEGIRVKISHNNVKNIIFNSNYKEKVINNLKVTDDFEKIIDVLGQPTFGDKDANVIGYKNEVMYVFFTRNLNMEQEISIYPNFEIVEENAIKRIENIIIGIYDKSLTKDGKYRALIGMDII